MQRKTRGGRGSQGLNLAHQQHFHRALTVGRTEEWTPHAMLHHVQTITPTGVAAKSTTVTWVRRMPSQAMGVSTPRIRRLDLGSPAVQAVVVDVTLPRPPVLV